MTPEEIMAAYDVLVQEGNDYAAQEAAKIGNSQASLGLMAERVARPSGQTSGLANYTYNRLLRPTVDTLAASLTTTGKSQAMDRYLKDQLMAAKNNYENAKNNYTVASTTPKTTTGGNQSYKETVYGGTGESGAAQIPYTAKGTVVGTGSTGNGVYDIIVADGKGGSEIHQYYGPSREEALNKYYRDYGGGPYDSSSTSGGNGKGTSGGGGGGGGGGGR